MKKYLLAFCLGWLLRGLWELVLEIRYETRELDKLYQRLHLPEEEV